VSTFGCGCLVTAVFAMAACGCAQAGGGFVRSFAYVGKGNAFRVNSPDTATGRYRDRPEARQTGKLTLRIDEDPGACRGAELYLELWGGHPGVARKRFTVNGKGAYPLPEVGAAAGHCTYSYPVVPLKLSDLVAGENVFQFACDKGRAFWGHYLLRTACVRLALAPGHPSVRRAGLTGFKAAVSARPGGGETIKLSLDCPADLRKRIASVAYRGKYRGYDENGDGDSEDFHGFTKDLKPVGVIAVAAGPAFGADWDLSMVPDGKQLAVRAVVRFKGADDLSFVTDPLTGVPFPRRDGRVKLICAKDLPKPFWSRAGREKTCTLTLDDDPARVERAQLHVTVWDGGKGKVAAPLRLNGKALPTPRWRGRHDLLYTVIDLDPSALRKGANEVRVHSDTAHHGIEVCLPGPALVVRLRGRRRRDTAVSAVRIGPDAAPQHTGGTPVPRSGRAASTDRERRHGY